jgi:hypothetical protein
MLLVTGVCTLPVLSWLWNVDFSAELADGEVIDPALVMLTAPHF